MYIYAQYVLFCTLFITYTIHILYIEIAEYLFDRVSQYLHNDMLMAFKVYICGYIYSTCVYV